MAHLFFSRLLYKWMFGLLAFALALSGAAILAGKLRHDPMAVLFTNRDGTPCEMPCLFGVRPGVTTLEEATVMIQSHPATYNLRPFMGDDFRWPDPFWGHISSVPTMYLGDGGQTVALNLEGTYNHTTHVDEDPVESLCMYSKFTDGTLELPPITPELATMWHRSSYLQMVATLGIPQTLYWFHGEYGNNQVESLYFDGHLEIYHAPNVPYPADMNNNFFSRICVLHRQPERTMLAWLAYYRGIIPWLGIYATEEDYTQWLIDHPPTRSAP